MHDTTSMMREDLLKRLNDIDEEASLLYPEDIHIHMIIVGGSALILMRYITRATHDIDVLVVSHQIEELMSYYDMNTKVQSYVHCFPYNLEDRACRVPAGGKRIDFFTASLEDIVISKLYTYRDTDLVDIKSPEIIKSIDWDLLERLATDEDEAYASAMNDYRYREFLQAYKEYKEEFHP